MNIANLAFHAVNKAVQPAPKMTKFVRDAAGQKIEITNFDYSDTHFEGVLATGRFKGRSMLFLKSRNYYAA